MTTDSPLAPDLVAIWTIPRPGQHGSLNGQLVATDPDWQRLWDERHVLSGEKRDMLTLGRLREIDMHKGSIVLTYQTSEAPLAEMARTVVTDLCGDAAIRSVEVSGRIASIVIQNPDGSIETLFVEDTHPGAYVPQAT